MAPTIQHPSKPSSSGTRLVHRTMIERDWAHPSRRSTQTAYTWETKWPDFSLSRSRPRINQRVLCLQPRSQQHQHYTFTMVQPIGQKRMLPNSLNAAICLASTPLLMRIRKIRPLCFSAVGSQSASMGTQPARAAYSDLFCRFPYEEPSPVPE